MNNADDARMLMRKTIDLFKSQLIGLDKNINDSLISTVRIMYNNQSTPIEQLALVSQHERKVSITPYDRTMVGYIEEELKKQGFNAYKFSKTTIIVNIPMDCSSNNKRVATQIRKLAEEARVSIRNIRRKFRKKDENDGVQLQGMTDCAIEEINGLVKT